MKTSQTNLLEVLKLDSLTPIQLTDLLVVYSGNQLYRATVLELITTLSQEAAASGKIPRALGTGKLDASWLPVGGGGSNEYENAVQVPVSLGGVDAGTTFPLGTTVQDVLTMLLYPYVSPTISAFSFEDSGLFSLEVGATYDGGAAVTFNWTTTSPSNIVAASGELKDLTDNISRASGLNDTGTTDCNLPQVVKTVAASHQWQLKFSQTEGADITRSFSVSWQWRVYYGTSANASLTENQIEALTNAPLKAAASGSYSFAAGNYKWLCYPTAMGLRTSFIDPQTNFEVSMEPATTVSVTNTYGVTTNYYCHRTTNTLGGSLTINVG